MSKLTQFFGSLQQVFLMMLPDYIGSAHGVAGTKVSLKGDNSPVTDLDRSTLRSIMTLVRDFYPEAIILGEEDGMSDGDLQEHLYRDDELQTTIDGLDGTWHLAHGSNSYGAMVSLRKGETILGAAIFRPVDQVLRGNGFYYSKHGNSAWRWCATHSNLEELATAKEGELERVTVLLEGGSKKFWTSPQIQKLAGKYTTRASLSSSIAATIVASGGASGIVTIDNKPWDNWPVISMVEEAGGIVTDWNGNSYQPSTCGNIVAAANQEESDRILEVINNH